VNFAALSAELAQSFPAELAVNSAQIKVENSAEVAAISAQTAGISAKKSGITCQKRQKAQQAAFLLPLQYSVGKAGKNLSSRFSAVLALQVAIGCCRYCCLPPGKADSRCATLCYRFL
jgi:hypothetical protein